MSKYARDLRRVERNLNNPLLWSDKFHKAMDRVDKRIHGERHMIRTADVGSNRKWSTITSPAPFHNGRKK